MCQCSADVGEVPADADHFGSYVRLPVLIFVGLMCVFVGFATCVGTDPVSIAWMSRMMNRM